MSGIEPCLEITGVTRVRWHDVVQDELSWSDQLAFERSDVVTDVVIVVATETAQTTLKNTCRRNLLTATKIAHDLLHLGRTRKVFIVILRGYSRGSKSERVSYFTANSVTARYPWVSRGWSTSSPESLVSDTFTFSNATSIILWRSQWKIFRCLHKTYQLLIIFTAPMLLLLLLK